MNRGAIPLLLFLVSAPLATADITADFTQMDDKDLVLENGTLLMNSTTDYAVGNYNLSSPIEFRSIRVEGTFPGNSSGQMTFYSLKDVRNAWPRRNVTRQGFTTFRESEDLAVQQSGIEAIQLSLFRNNATQTPTIESVRIVGPSSPTSGDTQNITTPSDTRNATPPNENATRQTKQPTTLERYSTPISATAVVVLLASMYLLLRSRSKE